VIRGESWGLVWEWGAFATVISRAPSASLAKSGASALPGLRALLGTLPGVGLRDTAVLVVRVSSSILGPVAAPEFFGVVVVLPGGWDICVSETDGWWGASGGLNGGEESSNCEEFHDYGWKQ
tara:strand:+ start:412 stop:777 length:366 start_codon:yes stop_codon:yes gene_type:complete